MQDEDFPKLRDSTRPNVEWLKAKKNPVVKPKAPSGILVNLPNGRIVQMKEVTDIMVTDDGWTGTDEP